MLMCLCSMTDFWRQMLQNKVMSHFLQHSVWVQTGKYRSKFYCLGDFFNMRLGSSPLQRATIHAKCWVCCRFGLFPLPKFRRFCLGVLTWAYLHFSFGNKKPQIPKRKKIPLQICNLPIMCRNNFSPLSPPGSYSCTDTHCFQWAPCVSNYAPGNSHLQDQAVAK